MPGTAAKIIISEKQQVLLEEFSKSRTLGKGVVQRATIVLLGFAGLLNEEIALRVGLNRQQAGIWRQRWRDAWDGAARATGRAGSWMCTSRRAGWRSSSARLAVSRTSRRTRFCRARSFMVGFTATEWTFSAHCSAGRSKINEPLLHSPAGHRDANAMEGECRRSTNLLGFNPCFAVR
jgi:hypothetical protein